MIRSVPIHWTLSALMVLVAVSASPARAVEETTLQNSVDSGDEPLNLIESVPAGVSPKPAERGLVLNFAGRVNHVEAVYDAVGGVTHLEISNHPMWVARHQLGEARPGLTDAEFQRITELRSLESLRILQQPLSDDAYAVLEHFPDLKAFRIEGHRTDEAAGRSHRFMRHINHCTNLEALELKHLFGLKGTSVDKLKPMPKLEVLELDNDSAGPEALTFLAGCPNLRDFELHRTSISDEQLGKMVNLLPKLERFVIKPGGAGLTASSLSHLQQLPELKVVGLHQWKRPGSLPWDDGLEHLLAVPKLEMVEFPGSYVTAGSEEVRRLRQAMPELNFKGLSP